MMFNKISTVTLLLMALSSQVMASPSTDVYPSTTLNIKGIVSGKIIELNDSSVWEIVDGVTYDPNIPCVPCYIKENWAPGDIVDIVPQNGNYGAYTHYLKNHKDNVKGAVNSYK